MPQKIFALFGPPGSGKGTQVERLKNLGIAGVSPGELLRKEVASNSELGQRTAQIMQRGDLVDDYTIVKLAKKYVAGLPSGTHLALDGVPRTLAQAVLLNSAKITPELVFVFQISKKDITARLSNRLVHPASGRVYHSIANPPMTAGKDNKTGEDLERRDDDKPKVVEARVDTYNQQAGEILDFYRALGITMIEVDATGSVEEVSSRIKSEVEAAINRKRRTYRQPDPETGSRLSSLLLKAKDQRDQYLLREYGSARNKLRSALCKAVVQGGTKAGTAEYLGQVEIVETQLRALQNTCELLSTLYHRTREHQHPERMEKDLRAAIEEFKSKWLHENRGRYVTSGSKITPRQAKKKEREDFTARFEKMRDGLDQKEVEAVTEAYRKAAEAPLPSDVVRLRKRYGC